MSTVIETEETALVEGIREVVSEGHAIVVACDSDYEVAGDFLSELKHKEKMARDFFGPMVSAAHQAHKAVKARENEVIRPLVEAKKTIGAEMGRYKVKREAEQARIRELEQAKAAREAAAREEEAAKAAAALEAEAKLAAERQADLAKAAATLEAEGKLAAAREAEVAREAAAREAEAKLDEAIGVLDEAQAAQEEADNLPVVEEPATPKIEGTSVRTTWRYEIVDVNLIPREFLCVDEKAIGGTVRSMKDKTSIPGVRVYSTTSVS